MTTPKKTPAQLDREIAEVLAERAAERRSPKAASGKVRKLLGSARRLLTRQRAGYNDLRDPARTIGKLADLAGQAITVAELELGAAQLAPNVRDIWADRFADALARAQRRVADLRDLIADPAGYAAVASQRFSEDTSPALATALYYVSALDDLVPALRRIEAMAERRST